MKKLFAFASLLCVFAVGCGGDPRDAHINNVLSALDNTSSNLSLVKKKLTDVLKKEKITPEDMKEINDMVEKIKGEGVRLQAFNRAIVSDTEKKPIPKEEQDKYKAKFAGQIESAVTTLDQETRAVIALADDLGRKNKKLADELTKNLRAAHAEFQQIASRK
jgi:DNA-directed RNA polymerase specialized sigma24 family protein